MMVTTQQIAFMPLPGSGQPILSVRPGVSSEEALEKASCILASVIAVARNASDDDDGELTAAIPDLVQLAKGIVDAVLESL